MIDYYKGVEIKNPMSLVNFVIDTSSHKKSWVNKRKDELTSKILNSYRYWNKIIKIPIYIASFLLSIIISYSPFYFWEIGDLALLQSCASAFLSLQLIRILIMIISDWIILKPKHKRKRLSTLYF